ncbi:hypothetical protein [Burkholderia cepacia]|uniref:hypothetical protein n=1 Tax=Burkholderia cepacia TaxID=292 RepID=UPI002AB67B07|nr:hypothetical protein [Burkholderia cepacia]
MLERGRNGAGRSEIRRAEKHVRASLKQVLRSSRQHYIRYGIGRIRIRIRVRGARGAAAPPSDGDTLA